MSRYFCIALACVIIGMTSTARVAAEQAAISQKVELLWPTGAPGAKGNEDGDKPTLTIYLPSKEKAATDLASVRITALYQAGLFAAQTGCEVWDY